MADQLLNDTQKFVQLLQQNTTEACIREVGAVITTVPVKDVMDAIRAVLPGLGLNMNDQYCTVTDIDVWKKIIFLDWTSRKQYVNDIFNCADFSNSFRAHVHEIYNLNSAGAFHCIVTNNVGTINQVGHRNVLIVAYDENKVLSAYIYESENEGISKVVLGQPTSIPVFGTIWTYSPVNADFD